MSHSPNPDASEIELRIQSLVQQVERPAPHTRRILAHLSQIEAALDQGVSRDDLARVFGLTTNQFAAAIAGARRLAKQGGDGRRVSAQDRKRGPLAGSNPATNSSASDQTLVRKF